MYLRGVFSTHMGKTMVISGLLAFICPIILKRMITTLNLKRVYYSSLLLLYTILILYLTIFNRDIADKNTINLLPFWTYRNFLQPQYRWEIYMNIFLFVPYGVLVNVALGKNAFKTIIYAFLLSVSIEFIQYEFKLGMCEFDDVFHNTIGALIGYHYWKMLDRLSFRDCK